MNAQAKQSTAAPPPVESKPEPAAPVAEQPAPRKSDAPEGYDVRMRWVNLIPKDLVIGGMSLFDKLVGRKDTSPNGLDIYWSRTDRHYWVGNYVHDALISTCRIADVHAGTSQVW